MTKLQAHGKFLITGEYLVLHGARSLALPLTKKFQTLTSQTLSAQEIHWRAFDENNHLWFEAFFALPDLRVLEANDPVKAEFLQKILFSIQEQKPEAFHSGFSLTTEMTFSPSWGLGSSSTLVSLLAQHFGVDAFALQKQFFKGSGYDVACATSKSSLIYELDDDLPIIQSVSWKPSFKNDLYFVYLGNKQDSREAMEQFKKKTPLPSAEDLERMNELTMKFLECDNLKAFQKLMRVHESLISNLLGVPPVKERLFSDFEGEIKSLGGWGGDFVMAASDYNPESYFKAKGHSLIFKWDDLIQ